MGTGTILWCTCIVAFQQNSVRSCWRRRFSLPYTTSTFVHYLNHFLSWSDPPAWSSIPADVPPHIAPPARSLDGALVSFSPADLPRDSPAHADSRCCSICAIPATLLCPYCEVQFCRSHVYQCGDCQTTLCGRCFDLHSLEGHWSDSDTASAMLGSAGKEAPRNQTTHDEQQQLASARAPRNQITHDEQQQLASARAPRNQITHDERRQLASARAPRNQITHDERQQLASARAPRNQITHDERQQLASSGAHHDQPGSANSHQLASVEHNQFGSTNNNQLAPARAHHNQLGPNARNHASEAGQ